MNELTARGIKNSEELRLSIHTTIISFFAPNRDDLLFSERFSITIKSLESELELIKSFSQWQESNIKVRELK
jgi:hypothetical protein